MRRSLTLLLGSFVIFTTVHAGPAQELTERSRAIGGPGKDRRFRVGAFVNVQVNVDELGQNISGDAGNEPTIAVDRNNERRIVVVWRAFEDASESNQRAGWAYSGNSGWSWVHPGVLDDVSRGDPALIAGRSGEIHLLSLNRAEGQFRAQLFKSLDAGASWGAPVEAFGGDKPWVTIDNSGGPGDGNVYVIWQDSGSCCGSRTFTRSTDGGATFDEPVSVPAHPTFGTLAVGPDSEIYAAGIDSTGLQDLDQFVVARSTNGWNPAVEPTFETVFVELGGSMRLGGGVNPGGLHGQANIDVDRSDGPGRGNVYLLASVNPPGPDPTDVHMIRSSDGGQTWSAPVRVNDDAAGNPNAQWMAAMSVAPDGRIDAVWNDSRNSAAPNVSELFYAYSTDQGQSWSKNVRVSPAFDSHVGWPGNENRLGDYYHMVSDTHSAHVAYAATFHGEQDIYYVRVFPDCNGNGRSDVADLDKGVSADLDADGVPDECG